MQLHNFSILPPSITSRGILSVFSCSRTLWGNNMISFSISLLFREWVLWREGTHQALSTSQEEEWLIYQQKVCYILALTFKQKSIPVLYICLTFASIQKSTHFYLIRNTRYFISKGCYLLYLKYIFPFLNIEVKETLNIKDKGYKSEQFQIRGKLLQRWM